MSERESSYERGYRLGRRQGWDLGAIAAYEALPHRLHYEDNPYAMPERTEAVSTWGHECPVLHATITLPLDAACRHCGAVDR